jgi:hypothetical protein
MEAYKAAGLGGMEITPIYGVIGEESKFIEYLSPKWMEMFVHTLREAERLDLGIDMATGTGWPFGGPWVGSDDAPKNMEYKKYQLQGEQRLNEPVEFVQAPYLRSVRNQVYQLYDMYKTEPTTGSLQNPILDRRIAVPRIEDLVEPVSANENLQGLALDQVKFEKKLPLQVLMAYSSTGEAIDLTDKVDETSMLDWVAPSGPWTLYAIFQGWHGKMVERAAPGGEGNTIDHFSTRAIHNYLSRFDSAFTGYDTESLRAFFNDSYEVDDARGQADWTPELFAEFESRRGYDLREHLPALFGDGAPEENIRVLCDYRETVSDLILDNFTGPWRKWARAKGAIIRNQSHGSPANILDLYAASDIPETEGTDLFRIKFASSAANVTGKILTSCEAATWLNEHFLSNLADIRQNVERYFLGGVNHVFYHGTAYSPPGETWPGWLFYAAVQLNPQNPMWRDFSVLNNYVTRIQSFLQQGKPHNDVLLYFPVYDRYSTDYGDGLLEHFRGGSDNRESSFNTIAGRMLERGYSFDLISDTQLLNVSVLDEGLVTGGAIYRTILVPECEFIPLPTFEKLVSLAGKGAKIVLINNPPQNVPGFFEQSNGQGKLEQLLTENRGLFLVGDDWEDLLQRAGAKRETFVDGGLEFVRRKHTDGVTYFVTNWGEQPVDGWVPIATAANSAVMFDPMSGQRGVAKARKLEHGDSQVYLQILPGESCILKTYGNVVSGPLYPYLKAIGDSRNFTGTWKLTFVGGGPGLPAPVEVNELSSWTQLSEETTWYSGSGRYELTFTIEKSSPSGWWLDLGRVAYTAKVKLNGEDIGALIGPNYRLWVGKDLIRDENLLEVTVSNLMANRIADLDKRGVFWKRFYNINFPAGRDANRGPDNLFTAKNWQPLDSGLLGPVTLTPVVPVDF